VTRPALLLLAALLAGCASSPRGSADTLHLAASAQTTGRLVVSAHEETTIRLANRGPGRADFAVRMGNGVELQSGALDTASVHFTSADRVVIVVALQVRADAPTAVECAVDGAGGARFEWDGAGAGR